MYFYICTCIICITGNEYCVIGVWPVAIAGRYRWEGLGVGGWVANG